MQQTLVILKPDAIQRQLAGRILSRFEDKGLKIVGMKMLRISLPLAQQMYSVHAGKPFYAGLVEFMTTGPVIAMVLDGLEAIAVVRSMIGPTFGPDAPGGTIRGDFGVSRRFNIVHASDSEESAAREIPLFFAPAELVAYDQATGPWIYAQADGKFL